MKHSIGLRRLSRLCIYFLSLHFILLMKILYSCKKHSNLFISKLYLLFFYSLFSYSKPGTPPRSTQSKRMNLKDTSVSHHKLPKQAITCKLAGIETDTLPGSWPWVWSECIFTPHLHLPGMEGQQKTRRRKRRRRRRRRRRRVPHHSLCAARSRPPYQTGQPNSTTLVQKCPLAVIVHWPM